MATLPQTILQKRPWLRDKILQAKIREVIETHNLVPKKILSGGAYSLVWLCEDNIVLKVLPSSREAEREDYTLRHWPVEDTQPLFYEGQILILRFHPGGTLAEAVWDAKTHTAVAQLCAFMHTERDVDTKTLPTLQDVKVQRFKELEKRMNEFQADKQTFQQVEDLRSRLLGHASERISLLHGDFTPGNILRHKDKLLPIDPKGAWGDPHSDWASWIIAGIPQHWQDRRDMFCKALEAAGLDVDLECLNLWCEYLLWDGWISSNWHHDPYTDDWAKALSTLG